MIRLGSQREIGRHRPVDDDRLTERREVADVRTSVVYEHIGCPVLEPLT
jgi:hypothetical protein